MRYAEVLFPQKIGPGDRTLTYQLPKLGDFNVGQLVDVPLRNRSARGVIYRTHDKKPSYQTKEITAVVKNAPHLMTWQLALMDWIAEYYFSPISKALRLFLPASLVKKKKLLPPLPPEDRSFELKFKHKLSDEQKQALATVQNTEKTVCLVHGITGSGKTEIYLHVVENCLKEGGQVLILIPEISLTPQMRQRFEDHFHEPTVVIHSQLTAKQKEMAWQSIHKGESKIIIGSRSALFAPFKNLRRIIIDEEHDSSYKQDQAPRYHAVEVAKKLAELLKIKIIMGSATPSLESYHAAKNGEYELLELSQRPTKNNLALPKAKIVDLREEIHRKNFSIFSEALQEKMAQKLENKEQIILFLNRRGAASAVICRTCGFVVNCQNCDIPMTYHHKISVEGGTYDAQRLVCHHCGRMEKVPTECPKCQSHYIKYIGLGTQRVEEEIQKLFPLARVMRADRDTIHKRDQFETLYKTFKNGKADILVGTQMIAIGLHFPKVNLVGIVLADMGLTIPDFRSSERTFQLITQVAGRSGREQDGEVVIQTYLPNHYAIQAAANHDYQGFYEKEIALRKELLQPPFSRLIRLTMKDPHNEKALNQTLKTFRELESINEKLEPEARHEITYFPALIPRLHNQYRWHILISGLEPAKLLRQVNDLSAAAVDVDPLSSV